MELHVSDVKQWFYCPRIVYYRYCLPLPRPVTDKMAVGAAEHEVLSVLERRRSLRAYGLAQGQRFFHVPLNSASLGLSGVLDLLILTGLPCGADPPPHPTKPPPGNRNPVEESPFTPSVSLTPLPTSSGSQAWVVEFKHTTQPVAENHRAQVVAYCLLVEECCQTEVSGAFLYRHPARRLTEVKVTDARRAQVRHALEEMRALITTERMPPPTPQRGKCVDCEYRRFCGDVV